jgi:integrase
MRLDAKTVSRLELPDDRDDVIHFDGALRGFGYRLRRSANGAVLRSWVCQYRTGNVQRRVRIGSDLLSAAEARQQAERVLAHVQLGTDVQAAKAERRARDKVKFRPLVDQYLQEMTTQVRRRFGEVRRPSTLKAMTIYLMTGDHFRPLHNMAIDAVKHSDVASCLRRIRQNTSETNAALARARLNSFFVWCMHEGFATTNPVALTRKPEQAAERSRTFSDNELKRIWVACGDPYLGDFGKIVRLLLCIPARRSEVGGMRWDELTLDGPEPTWRLPATRVKSHHSIVYPLLPTALSVLADVPQRVERDCLFGQSYAGGFSAWYESKKKLDAKVGFDDWYLHDARRSIATRLHAAGTEPPIVEATLNHRTFRAGVASTYNKHDYLPQIRVALTLWEDCLRTLLEGGEREVVSLPKKS